MDAAKRILVVDDDEAIRRLIAASLWHRCEVFVLASAQFFEEMVEDIGPDLVILDIRLPRRDGQVLSAWLRRSAWRRDIPVLFVSALPPEEAIPAVRAAGANAFLPKPFEILELRETVERLIDRAAAQTVRPGLGSGDEGIAREPA